MREIAMNFELKLNMKNNLNEKKKNNSMNFVECRRI